jgi:GntR family transcriptional regulator
MSRFNLATGVLTSTTFKRASTLSTLPKFSPLYQQIKDLLLKQLDDGVWKSGQVLPSEMELAAQMDVSQGTVRKAIDELVAENLLVRHQGKGTYVATHSAEGVPHRFLRLRPNIGERQPADSTVLSCTLSTPSANIALDLDLPPDTQAILVERVLSFSDKATVFEKVWLNQTLFPGITTERLTQMGKTFYAILETDFGVRATRAEEQIRAAIAPAEVLKILDLKKGEPVLQVTRISYSYKQQVVDVRESWYVTQDCYYWNDLL